MKRTLALSFVAFGAAATAYAFNPAQPVDDGQCGGCSAGKAKAALASKAAEKNIVETAIEAGQFGTLARLLTQAELVDALQGEGPFTVFAPTDKAFEKLLEKDKDALKNLLKKENKGLLTDILTFHVVSGKVMAKDAVKLSNATTLNGQRFDITVDEGTVMIDGAKVTMTDIECSNGVIHVIDSVIMPETQSIVGVAKGAKTFRTLLAAAEAAGLAETLDKRGPFTVFAPSDKAFAKLPEGTVETLLKPENKERLVAILKNHVVSGRVYADQAAKLEKAPMIGKGEVPISITEKGATIGGAKIVATDIEAANGVIHVIDSVLLPQ